MIPVYRPVIHYFEAMQTLKETAFVPFIITFEHDVSRCSVSHQRLRVTRARFIGAR